MNPDTVPAPPTPWEHILAQQAALPQPDWTDAAPGSRQWWQDAADLVRSLSILQQP